MRKTTKKLSALFLALVMAVSMLTVPATSVSAASNKVVKSLSVAKSKTLTAGETGTVKATVKTTKKVAKGNLKVTAKSSDKSVVTVKVKKSPAKKGKKGVSTIQLTGVSAGTATVTVTTKAKNKKNKKVSKKIKVTVSGGSATTAAPATTAASPVKNVESVTVSASRTSIEVGSDAKVSAVLSPIGATSPITWTSSDTAKAIVSSNGTVTGVSEGQVVITGTANNGVKGSVTITVTAVSVTGVKLSKSELELTVGQDSTLQATVEPSNATNKQVTWKSDDTSVARVDSKGVVTAVAAGTAKITVTTVDGAKEATITVTVTKDSSKDVDGVQIEVTNALEKYSKSDKNDYVLMAGTNAHIQVKVTKNGSPVSGKGTVMLDSQYGKTDKYKLSEDIIVLDEDGSDEVYIINTEKNSPVYNKSEDAAYASFGVTVTAGGATESASITVRFAQIMTQYEDYENHNVGIFVTDETELVSAGARSLQYTTQTAGDYGDYGVEYVASQETSDAESNKNHAVTFDATPMLMIPKAEGEKESGSWSKAINYTISDYSVYEDELSEKAYTVEDVPGGLKSATLNVTSIQLSEYTQLVIRAYKKDTNIPIVNDKDENVQMVIDSTTKSGGAIQIDSKVFEATKEYDEVDFKIFVESAGQVNEDHNAGVTITGITGTYSTEAVRDYEYLPMEDVVTWNVGYDVNWTASQTLTNAKSYIGDDNYSASCNYTYTMPAYPETGNAVIKAVDASENVTYYLYPTVSENGANKLVSANSSYAKEASIDDVKQLDAKKYSVDTKGTEDEDGNKLSTVKIDSEYPGYVPVSASINIEEAKVSYTLRTSIQWLPTPNTQKAKVADYYAIAGQNVKITAKVTNKKGSIVTKIPVELRYDDDESGGVTQIEDGATAMSDSSGIATFLVSGTGTAVLSDLTAYAGENYNVALSIGGNAVPSDSVARIRWVQPGIYYKPTVESTTDYNTATDSDEEESGDTTATEVKTGVQRHVVNETWIVGTKVVGAVADTDYNDLEVLSIDNIPLTMTPTSSENVNVEVKQRGDENGVYTMTSSKTGKNNLTVTVGTDKLDANKGYTITLQDDDTQEAYSVQSVGEGSIATCKDLIIPVTWVHSDTELSIEGIAEKYDISNVYEKTDGSDSTQYVYAYIHAQDANSNPVTDESVTYSVACESETIVSVTEATATEDSNGYIPVKIPVPTAAATYTLSAKLTNTQQEPTTASITFTKPENEQFTAETTEVNGSTATITFANSKTLQEALRDIKYAGFYTVKDKDDKTLTITNIEVSETNASQLIITVNGTASKVEINPSYTDKTTGITYYMLDDANGTLFTTGASTSGGSTDDSTDSTDSGNSTDSDDSTEPDDSDASDASDE